MHDFEMFWKEYPKKVAKGEARKAWIQTEKIRPDLETLLKAVKTAKRLEEWRKDAGKFVPYPATWLRAERGEDEYELDIEDALEVNGKVVNWWESATGIETRGREVGMTPEQFASWPEFKAAVLRQLMRAA